MKNRFYNTSNHPINHDLDNLIPTQDLDPIYLETSTFYIFSKDQFNKNKNRISEDSIKFPISKIESVDIDDYEDLSLEPEEEDSYRDMIQGKYSDDDLKLEPELDEASMTGTGTSISTGGSEAYATPYAFKKKRKED